MVDTRRPQGVQFVNVRFGGDTLYAWPTLFGLSQFALPADQVEDDRVLESELFPAHNRRTTKDGRYVTSINPAPQCTSV
jgi:hypothetical protein